MMGDSDRQGNTYFVSRSPDVVLQVDASLQVKHLAGITFRGRKPHHIGDGPPREAFFDTPNSLAAAPDGDAVFVCGGDEYDIRRVPTDAKTDTATLMHNGRWGHASRHPNKSRGPAVFKPQATGQLRPVGKLSNLTVGKLLGRDWQGNLYARMMPWSGLALTVEGQGKLPTRVYKLHKAEKLDMRSQLFVFYSL